MTSLHRRRSVRWAVPVAVAATIGLIAFVPTLSSAAPPDLPPITAEQLIAKVQQSNVEAFSGTFALTNDLGIPSLSSLQQQDGESSGFNPLDLLSGTHSADIAVDGKERQRITQRQELSENSVWHNGRDVWTWQSQGQQVTHLILPEHKAGERPETTDAVPTPTPDQLAKELLTEVEPSTAVSVTTPAYIADRPVYSLVLTPKNPDSTVDHVEMSVDSATGMPLEVSAWAKGKEKPAVRLGFTSISFGKPSGSFSFSPPAGANVTTKDVTKEHDEAVAEHEGQPDHAPDLGLYGEPTTVGQDWGTIVVVPHVELPAEAGTLYRATTPIPGPSGTARLLRTNLVNALLLDDGRLLAGFVRPEALQAAAAQLPPMHVAG